MANYIIGAILLIVVILAIRRIKNKGTCNCGHCSDIKSEKGD
ncbi:FeoB-associated Cys-rich membrane protein [Peptoniphilus stercorisuis]|uniref:FeoB-associated Cys-rich membrane protein n=1 Tax=Peptoniphilus stercorisuis TaxID=1436965 RepID=A0ABS4KDL9_9FIRM|nr:FeoB-associated Cys-rich membrane protein [Peptoniphilus stercorisuis]MBP2025874.1 hypothetical protein [Peptoniphilus stercorisuis]